jgi:hypothetical protein
LLGGDPQAAAIRARAKRLPRARRGIAPEYTQGL